MINIPDHIDNMIKLNKNNQKKVNELNLILSELDKIECGLEYKLKMHVIYIDRIKNIIKETLDFYHTISKNCIDTDIKKMNF